MNQIKFGLALGGGGAKGSYQVGVFKALEEAGLQDIFSVVSGTSIGAINTMLYMSCFNHLEMLDIWSHIENINIYGNGINKDKDKSGLYDLTPLFETLTGLVDIEKIKNSKIIGYANAAKIEKGKIVSQLNILDMEHKAFQLNSFSYPYHAVLASSSIPLLFGYTEIEDELYVDGGMVDNHALKPIIEEKCDCVFAVPVDRFAKFKKHKNDFKLIVDFSSSLAFHRVYALDLIDAMRFDKERITERFFYGYYVGKKIIQKLKDMYILGDHNIFRLPLGFTHVSLTKQEDKEIEAHVKELLSYAKV